MCLREIRGGSQGWFCSTFNNQVSTSSTSTTSETTTSSVVKGVNEFEGLTQLATTMLRDFLTDYGLKSHAKSVVLEALPVTGTDALSSNDKVILFAVFELYIDDVYQDAYKVTAIAFGDTRLQAEYNLAWSASTMVGDPLIAYLSRKGYDYETESLGGYGFYLTSLVGDEDDQELLHAFTSDMAAIARTILAAAEPVLLARLPADAGESAPGEPVGILQLTLRGTNTGSTDHTTVSALFDETGELSDVLNAGVKWPNVQGTYNISIGYGLK